VSSACVKVWQSAQATAIDATANPTPPGPMESASVIRVSQIFKGNASTRPPIPPQPQTPPATLQPISTHNNYVVCLAPVDASVAPAATPVPVANPVFTWTTAQCYASRCVVMANDTLSPATMATTSLEMAAVVTVNAKWATPVPEALQILRTHAPKLFLKH